METRRQQNVPKENNCKLTIIYPIKTSYNNEDEFCYMLSSDHRLYWR